MFKRYLNPIENNAEWEELMATINQPVGFTYVDSFVKREGMGLEDPDRSSKLFKNGRLIFISTSKSFVEGEDTGKGMSIVMNPLDVNDDPKLKKIEEVAIGELAWSDANVIHAKSYGRFLKELKKYEVEADRESIFNFFKKYQDQITEVGGIK